MTAPVPHEQPVFTVIQEDDVVATWRVGQVIAAGILVMLLSIAIAAWLLAAIRRELPWHEVALSQVAPREIARVHQAPIEHDPYERERRAQQRRSLEGYRWLDRERGTAEIPIERAMQLVVEQLAGSADAPAQAAP